MGDTQPAVGQFQEVLLSGGAKVLQQAGDFLGEGPKPLRFLCFLGGLVTALIAAVASLNIFSIILNPSSYILQLYLMLLQKWPVRFDFPRSTLRPAKAKWTYTLFRFRCPVSRMFGLLTMAVEAKDIPPLERMRPFFFSWFRFLTVPGGKGCFYLFYGLLSLSLWRSSSLLALIGLYTASMGVVCILVHFGMRQELQQHGITVSEVPHDDIELGRSVGPEGIASPAY